MGPQQTPARGTLASSAAAVLSALAAVSCCLPAGPFLIAAGLAGASGFLLSIQPYLIAFAVVMLAYGFAQAIRSRQCSRKRRLWNSAVLLCSTVMVAAMLFAIMPASAPAGQPSVASLDIAAFQQAFNADASRTRVIALFSPT